MVVTVFLICGILLVVLLAAVRRPRKEGCTGAADKVRSGSTGGGGSVPVSSGGYDANMNGPYGNAPVAGRDYPSSWHGPNEPGGSLDI